jgi:hypothetical protein
MELVMYLSRIFSKLERTNSDIIDSPDKQIYSL